MLGASWLVGVAGHLDGAVVGCRSSLDQALRIESAIAAAAIGHAFRDAAAIGVDQPMKIKHFAKWNRTKIEIEACDEHIVTGLEQMSGEQK